MNFLHFAVFLFLLSVAVLVLVSLTAPAPDAARIAPLVWDSHHREHARGRQRSVDAALSIVVLALVGAAWLAFA